MSGAAPREAAEERPIRVFVVDDHAVVRRGLEAYLEMVDDLEVVGEAADGKQALDPDRRDGRRRTDTGCGDHGPGDARPGWDHCYLGLTEQLPEIDVVAMTSFSEAERVERAPQAGASG